MNDNTTSTSEIVSVRLTLNVAYLLNGEPAQDMITRLQRMCEHAIGHGMLTGDSAAEVDEYTIHVSVPPAPLPEDAIAGFMRQRIEDGNLDAEDIPTRLARYGLMAPDDFIAEMRERLETAEDDGAADLFGGQP
ncbi:hypothetical protein [Ralstonia mannitolilytica]|jgi:hypothetical protein|uniref:hypothetical protein n=1 Tax=Ralstonia mannitolilytica TaxID=105219 RepID=UPI002155918A|nr:hypothetical protein [Ralstonia mannitolilytica]